MRLNRSRGYSLCCSFLHWSFVCVQSTKGSVKKQDIHHLDRQNKLHTEENLNVSPRLIVSRPAAGEPAHSSVSIHPLRLLLDVRLTTRPCFEHRKAKALQKTLLLHQHYFCFCEVSSEVLHIQTFHGVHGGRVFTASEWYNTKVMSLIISLRSSSVWWWQFVNFMQYVACSINLSRLTQTTQSCTEWTRKV